MAEAPVQRYFTVDEANATLQTLRPIIAEILEIRSAILERQPEIWSVIAKAAGNGGNRAAGEAELEFQRINSLVRQIHALGVLLKDVNIGLLDFLSIRDGKDIYLCWRYGEAEIRYWHELEAGFSGRQAL